MSTTYRFWFWQEWLDDKGRMWASHHEASDPSQARTLHNAALQFLWAQRHMRRPSVSDLFATNGDGAKAIASGAVREAGASPAQSLKIGGA